MGKPTLVVICGPGGTGKTTLAHRLAPLIGCPVVSRDEIKEGMVHASPGFVANPDDELTQRTLGTFFEAIDVLIRAEVTLIVEAAFQHHLWRPRLQPLLARAHVRVIPCFTEGTVANNRQVRRLRENPVRAAHADADQLRVSAVGVATEDFKTLALDVPTLRVDTTSGYRPRLNGIVAFAEGRSSAEPSRQESSDEDIATVEPPGAQ